MAKTNNIRPDHIRLIAWRHAKYSIRGGAGLVFALAVLIAGLLIAQIFIGSVEELNRTSQIPITDIIANAKDTTAKVFAWVLGSDDKQSAFLTKKPALISAFLVVLIFVLPFLVSLGAFNQTSGDIANRGLRYQLLRTERANIFLGRFVGTVLFTTMTLIFLMAVVTLYVVLKASFYPASDVALWMLWGTAAVLVIAIPYIALYGWVSCAIDSPFGSLVLGILIVGAWPILIMIAKLSWKGAAYGNYLMPWGYKFFLLHPSPMRIAIGVLVMLAFTSLFLLLGLRHFQKRDL